MGLSSLDFDTIALIAPAFGFEAKNTKQTEKDILETLKSSEEEVALVPKPPVVTHYGDMWIMARPLYWIVFVNLKLPKEKPGGSLNTLELTVSFLEKILSPLSTLRDMKLLQRCDPAESR